jgi:hypothetical protein
MPRPNVEEKSTPEPHFITRRAWTSAFLPHVTDAPCHHSELAFGRSIGCAAVQRKHLNPFCEVAVLPKHSGNGQDQCDQCR